MTNTFEKLNRINSRYRSTIDALSAEFVTESERDARYSDELIAERVRDRTDRFNGEIEKAATEAVQDAAPLVEKLRTALKEYVASAGDPASLTALQSLIAADVNLSDAEIQAFASTATSYSAQLLLEKASGGHFTARRMGDFEADLQGLTSHFRSLRAYRGGMTGLTTEIFWGSSATVGSFIEQKQIDGFAAKLDEISARWTAVIREED